MSLNATNRTRPEGEVARGFEGVREAFVENFTRRHELGGACCVFHQGRKVVDIWGGVRNKPTGEPWERDTMVIVYSATKGLAAMTLALAHSRGWLDYEERVCTLLAGVRAAGQGADHRSAAPRAPGGTVRIRRARRSGAWWPISIAWRASWSVRRPRGSRERGRRITRSRSASTRANCCAGSIRVIAVSDSSSRTRSRRRSDSTSTSVCRSRFRTPGSPRIAPPGRLEMLLRFPLRVTLAAMNPRSNIYRALVTNPGSGIVARRTARVFAQPRSAVGWRRRHGAGDRARLQRLRNRRTGAGPAKGNAGPAGRASRFRRRVDSTTSA